MDVPLEQGGETVHRPIEGDSDRENEVLVFREEKGEGTGNEHLQVSVI